MSRTIEYQRVPNIEVASSPVTTITERGNRAKWAYAAIILGTTGLVFGIAWKSRHEVKYVPIKIANETCYKRHVETTYHGLFVCALTVFSVVIGTLVDRLTLVAEEILHVKSRYDGSRSKMLKACFSGLRGWVILLAIIFAGGIVVLYVEKIKTEFKLDYLVLLFSGIGFGPLVQRFLNLDTQSEVHISTVLEEKGTTVANILAWSYYVRDLKIVLPKIQHAIERSRWKGRVSSSKLVILLPLDCLSDPDNLPCVDKRLSNEGKINCEERPELSVRVLGVQSGGTKKYFFFTFASALQTIFSLSELEKFSALSHHKREEEVASFCQNLQEIVSNPVDLDCRNKCVVIPYKQIESGSNNWLVDNILETENNPLATDSSALPVGSEHEDQTRVNNVRVTADSDTTHAENTATEDEGRENERSSCNIHDNEAHVIDRYRAEQHQPSSTLTSPQPCIDSQGQTNNTQLRPSIPQHSQETSYGMQLVEGNGRPIQLNGKDDEVKNVNNVRVTADSYTTHAENTATEDEGRENERSSYSIHDNEAHVIVRYRAEQHQPSSTSTSPRPIYTHPCIDSQGQTNNTQLHPSITRHFQKTFYRMPLVEGDARPIPPNSKDDEVKNVNNVRVTADSYTTDAENTTTEDEGRENEQSSYSIHDVEAQVNDRYRAEQHQPSSTSTSPRPIYTHPCIDGQGQTNNTQLHPSITRHFQKTFNGLQLVEENGRPIQLNGKDGIKNHPQSETSYQMFEMSPVAQVYQDQPSQQQNTCGEDEAGAEGTSAIADDKEGTNRGMGNRTSYGGNDIDDLD